MQYCNLSELNLKNFPFNGSKLMGVQFTNTLLNAADFRNTDLKGTNFDHCDLCKADFIGATAYDIDLKINKIKKAKFSLGGARPLLRCFEITIS